MRNYMLPHCRNMNNISEELNGFCFPPPYQETTDFPLNHQTAVAYGGDFDEVPPIADPIVANHAFQGGNGGINSHAPPRHVCLFKHKSKPSRRSAETHSLNERLRRQRLKERMDILSELIPNSSKKDKTSTLDDAIRYIKMLQCHIQMTSMGTGIPVCSSLLPASQSSNNPAFLHPSARGGVSICPCMNHPMANHFGLSDPCVFGSSTMTMPHTCDHGIQNTGPLGPLMTPCAATLHTCEGGNCVLPML